MNRKALAKELIKVASSILAIEFDTDDEMKQYKKDHDVQPGTKMTVKETDKETDKKTDKETDKKTDKKTKYKNAPSEFNEIMDGPWLPAGVSWDGEDDGSISVSAESREHEKPLRLFLKDIKSKFPKAIIKDVNSKNPNLDFKIHFGEKIEKSKTDSKPAGSHKKSTPKPGSLKKVQEVMKANKLSDDSDELKELAGFKKTLGQRVPEGKEGEYYVRNKTKLKKDFVSNMNAANYSSPEAFASAKKRIQQMTTADFAKILAAIVAEDE